MSPVGRSPADEYMLQVVVSQNLGRVAVVYWAGYKEADGSMRHERITQQGFSRARLRSPEKVRTVAILMGNVEIMRPEEDVQIGN